MKNVEVDGNDRAVTRLRLTNRRFNIMAALDMRSGQPRSRAAKAFL